MRVECWQRSGSHTDPVSSSCLVITPATCGKGKNRSVSCGVDQFHCPIRSETARADENIPQVPAYWGSEKVALNWIDEVMA